MVVGRVHRVAGGQHGVESNPADGVALDVDPRLAGCLDGRSHVVEPLGAVLAVHRRVDRHADAPPNAAKVTPIIAAVIENARPGYGASRPRT